MLLLRHGDFERILIFDRKDDADYFETSQNSDEDDKDESDSDDSSDENSSSDGPNFYDKAFTDNDEKEKK